MKNLVRKIVPAVAAAGVLMLASAAAQAECVKKAGSGTGGNVDSAKFQAWEAVLQATDWGSWGGLHVGRRQGADRARLQGQRRALELQARRHGADLLHASQALQVSPFG